MTDRQTYRLSNMVLRDASASKKNPAVHLTIVSATKIKDQLKRTDAVRTRDTVKAKDLTEKMQ